MRLAGAKVVETLSLRQPARRVRGATGHKGFHERRFPTPGLAGHEHHLPRAAVGLGQALLQGGEFGLAAYQQTRGGSGGE